MKKITLNTITILLVSSIGSFALAQCQDGGCALKSQIYASMNQTGPSAGGAWPCQGGTLNYTFGNTDVNCPSGNGLTDYPSIKQTLSYASRDPFSPHPLYAYSANGIDASMTHKWNQQMAQTRSWHEGYNYWRWNRPTALVVPPTAAFSSQYSWGVGQTKSLPIYHQFGRTNPGSGGGAGQYSSSPYWPSSTQQLGVYPVRASW